MLKIDRQKLRTDIHAVVTEIRALKAICRESGQPRLTWRVWTDLGAAKLHATALCALAAHARGRIHLASKMDAEAQLALVQPLLPKYARPEPEMKAA
jgi:hypothetical protein